MTKNKNTIVDEIHAIRLELYEKTKHMTNEEIIDFIKKETSPIHEKFGFKTISRIDEALPKHHPKKVD